MPHAPLQHQHVHNWRPTRTMRPHQPDFPGRRHHPCRTHPSETWRPDHLVSQHLRNGVVPGGTRFWLTCLLAQRAPARRALVASGVRVAQAWLHQTGHHQPEGVPGTILLATRVLHGTRQHRQEAVLRASAVLARMVPGQPPSTAGPMTPLVAAVSLWVMAQNRRPPERFGARSPVLAWSLLAWPLLAWSLQALAPRLPTGGVAF